MINLHSEEVVDMEDGVVDTIGSFQLLDLIVTELKSHMTC